MRNNSFDNVRENVVEAGDDKRNDDRDEGDKSNVYQGSAWAWPYDMVELRTNVFEIGDE